MVRLRLRLRLTAQKLTIKINLFESLMIKIKLNFDYKKITIRFKND